MPGFHDAVPQSLDPEPWERDLLIELLEDRIREIERGERSGFHEPVEDVLADTRKLLAKVEAAR
jgi:hypothetical protein